MSLLWKVSLLLVMVLAVTDCDAFGRHHLLQKKHGFHKAETTVTPVTTVAPVAPVTPVMNKPENAQNPREIKFEGHIYCKGKGLDGVMTRLLSTSLPRIDISSYATHDGGKYTLSKNSSDHRGRVFFTVRHRCEMKGLPLIKKCRFPHYITRVNIDLSNNVTNIKHDFELSTMEAHSHTECLT